MWSTPSTKKRTKLIFFHEIFIFERLLKITCVQTLIVIDWALSRIQIYNIISIEVKYYRKLLFTRNNLQERLHFFKSVVNKADEINSFCPQRRMCDSGHIIRYESRSIVKKLWKLWSHEKCFRTIYWREDLWSRYFPVNNCYDAYGKNGLSIHLWGNSDF